MSNEKNIEGNKLIAKFADAEMPSYSKDGNGNITSCSLRYNNVRVDYIGNSAFGGTFKFHSSWDWLIPICKKWEEIDISEELEIEYTELSEKLALNVSIYNIEISFEQLVENIKWYNQKVKGI